MKILLAVDHGLLSEAVARVLGESERYTIYRCATRPDAVLTQARRCSPNVVLVESKPPASVVLHTIRLLRGHQPRMNVILLALHDDDEVSLAALQEGARGFIDRGADSARLMSAIDDVISGSMAIGPRLAARLAEQYVLRTQTGSLPGHPTERELQVLAFVAQGLTNRDIAATLYLSEHTVRAHMRNIAQKLDVENRVQAVARAIALGLLPSAPSDEDAELLSARA